MKMYGATVGAIFFFAFFVGIIISLGMFRLALNIQKRMGSAKTLVPKIIVDNYRRKEAPFHDATDLAPHGMHDDERARHALELISLRGRECERAKPLQRRRAREEGGNAHVAGRHGAEKGSGEQGRQETCICPFGHMAQLALTQ